MPINHISASVCGRIPYISFSSTSDGVILTYTDVDVAELSVSRDIILYYTDVSISSKDDVTDGVTSAQVCFKATDNFG